MCHITCWLLGDKALRDFTEKTQPGKSPQRESDLMSKGSRGKSFANSVKRAKLSSELVKEAEESANWSKEKSAERTVVATAKSSLDSGTKGSAETTKSLSTEKTQSRKSLRMVPFVEDKEPEGKRTANSAEAAKLSSELVRKGSAERSDKRLGGKSAERMGSHETVTKGSAETTTSKSAERIKSAESTEVQPKSAERIKSAESTEIQPVAGKAATVPLSKFDPSLKKDLLDMVRH